MKLSLSGRIIETAQGSALPIREFIQMASSTGYDCVDIRYSQINTDYSDDLIGETESALADSGIAAVMMNAGSISSDVSLEGLIRIAEAAKRLGCDLIRISGSPEMIQKAADEVAPLRLCSQIHTGGEYETIASTKETLAEIGRDNFGVLVEPANLLMAGESYGEEALAQIGDSVFGVNLQSIKVVGSEEGSKLNLRDGTEVSYTRVPLGENAQMDTAGFISALKAVGFDAFINVLEPHEAGVNSATVAQSTAETLRSLL